MIHYVIPVYVDNRGECCKVKDNGQELILEKAINRTIKNLYKERFLDYNVIKQQSEMVIYQKNLIPLYLSKSEIMIPVKLRIPIVESDTYYGYINYYCIDDVTETHIILKDGTSFEIYEDQKSILKRLKNAQLIANRFDDALDYKSVLKGEMECAATKEDIAIVLYEIGRLKKHLDLM